MTVDTLTQFYHNAINFYQTYKTWILLSGILLLSLLCIAIIAYLRSGKYQNKKIRKQIANSRVMHYKTFERNWIKPGKPRRKYGYKYNDMSGCYVITLYEHRITNSREYLKYKNIYIGQSVNICQRVHNHINGKGKGDVYADIKYGKEAYIVLVPCKKEKMNALEKKLIRAFNSTKSYNVTKGGGRHR